MKVWLEIEGRRRCVEVPDAALGDMGAGALTCQVDGQMVEVDARMVAPGVLSLLVAGRQFRCVLDRDVDGEGLLMAGRRTAFTVADPRSLSAQSATAAGVDGPRPVKAPMPGRVVRVLAAVGDAVAEGQGLIVIEAMKMQNELKSPKAGLVARIAAGIGATVAAGEVLVVVE